MLCISLTLLLKCMAQYPYTCNILMTGSQLEHYDAAILNWLPCRTNSLVSCLSWYNYSFILRTSFILLIPHDLTKVTALYLYLITFVVAMQWKSRPFIPNCICSRNAVKTKRVRDLRCSIIANYFELVHFLIFAPNNCIEHDEYFSEVWQGMIVHLSSEK